MYRDLKLIIGWLRDSNLVVNNSKTRLCQFNKQDMPHVVTISLWGIDLEAKHQVNILALIFDIKLQCAPKISQTMSKAKQALQAIKPLKLYFERAELRHI